MRLQNSVWRIMVQRGATWYIFDFIKKIVLATLSKSYSNANLYNPSCTHKRCTPILHKCPDLRFPADRLNRYDKPLLSWLTGLLVKYQDRTRYDRQSGFTVKAVISYKSIGCCAARYTVFKISHYNRQNLLAELCKCLCHTLYVYG